jgi:hypothetical protein
MIRESTHQPTKRLAFDALLALALLASMAISGFAQSSTWTSTGSMKEAREDQTATLLQNSQVLGAGSFDGSNHLATAELGAPS